MTQSLEVIPSVLLFYSQKQGKKLEINLEVTKNFSESLQVALINQRGDLLVTPIIVISPNWTGELSLEDIPEGSYLLQVLYQDYVLDKTTFELLDEASAQQMEEFQEGLEIEDRVTQALEKGNYTEAMTLQEKAAKCYHDNPELAARSWEELAEKLYEKQQFLLSKRGFK
jgi:sulfur transfer complex TusBCD TusB component (DsrH family)